MSRIHVYTVMYNEEILLPYFLRHYGPLAEKIVVFDNMSTDRSAQLVDAHPGTERIPYDTGGKILDRRYLELKGQYRRSRGKADWVIVVDIDEFIYHPRLGELLDDYQARGITYPKVRGFEMVGDDVPRGPGQIYDEIKLGVEDNVWFAKRIVFKPDLELTFEAGCHTAQVSGNVVESPEADLTLLHYSYLGMRFFVERYASRRERLSDENKAAGWGAHYQGTDESFASLYDYMRANAKPVIAG